jgi:predicted RNA binding protein YcfA (HicA-like mRNA interferase family)
MPKIVAIPAWKLRRVFERAGFVCVRIEGDHFVFTKPGVSRPVVIPDWKEVPVFIIKNNLRSAGLNRDDYFELLND